MTTIPTRGKNAHPLFNGKISKHLRIKMSEKSLTQGQLTFDL